MKCPAHGREMPAADTSFGPRHACPVPGCAVICWGGPTSTPADAETRALRHACHQKFDPLWRDRGVFKSRPAAYRWLARVMGQSRDTAHIGMFDRGQCNRLLAELSKFGRGS